MICNVVFLLLCIKHLMAVCHSVFFLPFACAVFETTWVPQFEPVCDVDPRTYVYKSCAPLPLLRSLVGAHRELVSLSLVRLKRSIRDR